MQSKDHLHSNMLSACVVLSERAKMSFFLIKLLQQTSYFLLYEQGSYLFMVKSVRETVGKFYETPTPSFHFIGGCLPEYSFYSLCLILSTGTFTFGPGTQGLT